MRKRIINQLIWSDLIIIYLQTKQSHNIEIVGDQSNMQPLIFGNSAFKHFQYFYVTLIIQPEFEELKMLPKDLQNILSTKIPPKK